MEVMQQMRDEMQRTINDQWSAIVCKEKLLAAKFMGQASVNPALRTREMRDLVHRGISRCNFSLADSLVPFGFAVYTRGDFKKLTYTRKDGRVFNDIVLCDGCDLELCVEDLDLEVFNHLYLKFLHARYSAVQKAMTTKLEKRQRAEEMFRQEKQARISCQY